MRLHNNYVGCIISDWQKMQNIQIMWWRSFTVVVCDCWHMTKNEIMNYFNVLNILEVYSLEFINDLTKSENTKMWMIAFQSIVKNASNQQSEKGNLKICLSIFLLIIL